MLKSVAVLAFQGMPPFDLGVLWEVFGIDRAQDGVPTIDFRVIAVGPQSPGWSFGTDLGSPGDFAFVDNADLVAVPGASWRAGGDPDVQGILRRAHSRGAWILSICRGAFVLADAGLLDGVPATTHWMHVEELAASHPQVDVRPDVLYVEQDRIVTSAGTAAGIDAALHVVRLELGAEAANTIARRMVVPPQRDGGQAQYIENPMPEYRQDSLSGLLEWMQEHLDEPLTIAQLAERALMSPRTFARRFRAETGTTPAAWLNRLRVLQAQRLLESTDQTVDQIAQQTGFGAAPVLRHHFQRTLRVSPKTYRSMFTTRTTPADPVHS